MQPATLGRYKIVKELGRGAMGRVLLAHDPQIDRAIAVKTIQIFAAIPEADRAAAGEALLREARAAGRLIHPGIVTLFDVGEADGLLYLAMEYVEGPTLDTYAVSDKLLPIRDVVEMIAEVAEALDYAHRSGIVHRDIKPANLIHVGGSKVKIMDFGLAKPSESQLTNDGALHGTPAYMSPEQIRGLPLDGRSDLFSLAVVLFELASGERPFPGDSVSSIIYRIVNEEPLAPRECNARIPAQLASFLARALAKDPKQRIATGAEFASQLRGAVKRQADPGTHTGDRESSIPPASLPRARAPVRSSVRPFVLGVLLLIALLGGTAYMFRDRLGWFETPEVWWETVVRTEPPGVELLLDGQPLDPAHPDLVRFQPEGPFGVLTAAFGCRRAEHQIQPADAGGEVILVLDPVEVIWPVDPGWNDATVRLNGTNFNAEALELDLCRDNNVELEATGFFPTTVEIPAETTPLQARTLLSSIQLEPIPTGRLAFPDSAINLVYYVDGDRVDLADQPFELTAGEHDVRLKNERYWIDQRHRVTVVQNETLTPSLVPPALTDLVVQAFPANCKIFLRRPGGKWKYLDDTPMRTRIAVGRYEVRVKLNPTGETRDQAIELVAGDNPPVRVSFRSSS
jgi:predicted Ser/Thr protein kinase